MNLFAQSDLERELPPQEAGPSAGPTPDDAFTMGGLAGMDKYRFGVPHEVFGGYDKAVAQRDRDEAQLAKSQSRSLSANPFANFGDQTPMVALTPEDRAKDRRDIKTIGSMTFPSTPLDVLTMLTPWRAAKGALAGITTALSGHDTAEAGMTPRQAMLARRARAGRMGGTVEQGEYNLPSRFHNMPPAEMRIAPDVPAATANATMGELAATVPSLPAMTPKQAEQAWMQSLPRPQPAAQSTAIPDIRELSVEDAIKVARNQPHLINAGEQSPGKYVGGPRDITSKAGLNAQRRDFDQYVAADPRGYDWYDRQRGGINQTTGGDPLSNEWQSKLHGQFSAGVDPGSELHFVLKENNAMIAGMPVKAARPAQHEAVKRAIEMRDPNQLQLGDKTWEYADKSNPNTATRNAVGVNDFRYAYQQGHRTPEGDVSKAALTDAQHKFLDYETALAVDRANAANLGGRSDWTGEQLQAAPWVRQKAIDIMNERPGMAYEEAFKIAMQSIAEHQPKHVYNATHEFQPGANVGTATAPHMAESVNAPQSVRDQFALDPRSTWKTAPGGRDAIYSGLGVEGTGMNMRVMPTIPMRGMYTPEGGPTEFNMGEVARPLGTFTTPTKYDKEFVGPRPFEPFKRATDADKTILNAGEAVRGLIDAQNASAWHKTWRGGPVGQSTSLFFPRSGPATEAEMLALRDKAAKYGLTDIVDTGQGITATKFYEGPPPGGKDFDRALRKEEFGEFGIPARVRVGPDDSGYIDYVDKWREGIGSGAATRHMLEYVNKTPELRDAFNRNADIPKAALARLERDEQWAGRWGAPRQDIQNLRKIIAEGGAGWLDRIDEALRNRAILPATVAALFAGALAAGHPGARDAAQ